MTMRPFVKGVAIFALAVALTALGACAPQQPSTPGSSGAAAIGSSQYNASLPPPSPSGTVVGGAVDQADSQNLTDYLKNHHLPLVNGQVVMSPAGKRQVILFGYVASEYGKSDAEQKTRTFLNDPQVLVDNRITISPELAGSEGGHGNGSSNGSSASNSGGSGSYDPYATSNSIQAYQQQGQFDPYAAQQQYPTNNFSGLNLLMGLLGGGMSIGGGGGGFGGGFGGGGYGGGFGGFGGGPPSSFGGYGYPSYPPPPMGSGFP